MPEEKNLSDLHPNDVFFVYVSHWQPDPKAANPEMPGLKAMMTMLKLAEPEMPCVCGSGRTFGSCCRRRNYWIPVCVNPDFEGYSKVEILSLVYPSVDEPILRKALANDRRFRCVDDGEDKPHWLFHSDSPKRFAEYGEINLGDIELNPDGSLLVTAMSRTRMAAIRESLEQAGLGLPEPILTIEPSGRVKKPLRLSDMLPGIMEADKKARQVRVAGFNRKKG
jgi:hypothetical protein